jgi:hypothetical protein
MSSGGKMYKCQQSLIAHLGTQFTSPTVRTIEEYAGQLKEDAKKLTQLLPAVLVKYIEGKPAALDKQHRFDLLVITQSRTFDKKTNKNNNIQLVSGIAAWIKNNNHVFTPHDSSSGTYEIVKATVRAKTLEVNNRFCIVALSLEIMDNTP